MVDTTNITVGKVLRQLRLEQGLTQAHVARCFNTRQSMISKLETGAQSLYMREVFDYAEALGITSDMLFYQVCRALIEQGRDVPEQGKDTPEQGEDVPEQGGDVQS